MNYTTIYSLTLTRLLQLCYVLFSELVILKWHGSPYLTYVKFNIFKLYELLTIWNIIISCIVIIYGIRII